MSLHSVTHKTPPNWHNNWNIRYNGTTAFAANAQHVGYETAQPPQKPVLNNVDAVGVASGATLSTTDGVTIKGLSVDMDGAGTISGFAFAEEGVLNVENCQTGGTVVLPGTYENVTGLSNLANWTVFVNGKEAPRRKASVSGGTVTLSGTGMVIMVQ